VNAEEERPSFLKKRSKILLLAVADQGHKSFLVLFFKKELLSAFWSHSAHAA
jgi:hypothetical protein